LIGFISSLREAFVGVFVFGYKKRLETVLKNIKISLKTFIWYLIFVFD